MTAAGTSERLHDAIRDGVPLLIPGALEPRPPRPSQPQPIDQAAFAAATLAASLPANDLGRLEHEREGGGAPSERSGPGMLARLWRRVSSSSLRDAA